MQSHAIIQDSKSRDNTGQSPDNTGFKVTWQYRVQSHVTIQGSKSPDNTGFKVTWQYRVQSHATIQGSKSPENTGLKVTWQYRAQSHVTIQGSKSPDNTGFKVTWQYCTLLNYWSVDLTAFNELVREGAKSVQTMGAFFPEKRGVQIVTSSILVSWFRSNSQYWILTNRWWISSKAASASTLKRRSHSAKYQRFSLSVTSKLAERVWQDMPSSRFPRMHYPQTDPLSRGEWYDGLWRHWCFESNSNSRRVSTRRRTLKKILFS